MSRAFLFKIVALSVVLTAPAHAGVVPDQAVKDADGGYFHRELTLVQPLLADHGQDADVQFRYGQALLGIGKANDAIQALKGAIAIDPGKGLYHRLLGEAYGLKAEQQFAGKVSLTGVFSMMGVMKSVRTEFRAAVQLAPSDVKAHVDLAMFYIMAPGIVGGSYSKAHAEEAIIAKLDPVQGLQVRANEAANKDHFTDSEALMKQAVAQDKTADSLIELGLIDAQAKHYPAAFQALRDAKAKDPNAYAAWYQMGRVAGIAKSNYDEGVASLKQYLTFDDLPDTVPSQAWAHFRLGNLYEYQGQTDQAKAEYQKADALNHDGDPELVAQLDKAEARIKSAESTKQ